MSARLLFLMWLAGCASVPRATARSATSLALPAAPAIPVAHALRADPPLPGEPTDGWPGLDEAATEGGHHHAH